MSASVPVAAEPQTDRFQRILLASEGREIPRQAIDRVIELAARGATVHVLTVARVHGTAFGFPSPGLLPTKREWAQQRDIVAEAIKHLERHGLKADGHVLGTRDGAKKIVQEAIKTDCQAIVMAADPDRNRVVGNLMWTQEPQRVRRRAKVPVYLVVEEAQANRATLP
jgi:nucleotide-binding universal stress UspA family protein